ncbi:hypothetical protein AYI70_g12336 [Smittium culicis]|uniref:Uncharacterized protein n=1 Tax=Smittium culicis TaxID=133412 RepID=A0A1R1WXZ1_9FUNG|nr:hypothetical protein AYI70_g12336 [Smittium culicis]
MGLSRRNIKGSIKVTKKSNYPSTISNIASSFKSARQIHLEKDSEDNTINLKNAPHFQFQNNLLYISSRVQNEAFN